MVCESLLCNAKSQLSGPPANNSAGANEPLKPGEQATSLHLSSAPTRHNRDLDKLYAALIDFMYLNEGLIGEILDLELYKQAKFGNYTACRH